MSKPVLIVCLVVMIAFTILLMFQIEEPGSAFAEVNHTPEPGPYVCYFWPIVSPWFGVPNMDWPDPVVRSADHTEIPLCMLTPTIESTVTITAEPTLTPTLEPTLTPTPCDDDDDNGAGEDCDD